MKWKHHGFLLAYQIVATQWLHIYCINSQKSNILWFVLDRWPLKILAPTWTQICFFRNVSSSTEINQMKWKHHEYLLAQRAVNTLEVHIVLHEPSSGLLSTVHWLFEHVQKNVKNTEPTPNKTQTFFCWFYWSYGLCTTSHFFSVLAQS